jgi:3-hydroxybutyryl-CoA dehydrogenase
MGEELKAADITIGVVGLGLMGSSIVVSLLLAGHEVVAIEPVAGERDVASTRIHQQLKRCEKHGMLNAPRERYLSMLTVSDDYGPLRRCELVLECVIEKMDIKDAVYQKIASASSPDTIIATNTSAIPISILQELVCFPDRFIGIHWSEPAFATRFLEITCGRKTSQATADRAFAVALLWGKEPTVLRKDIRGFITNRLMYAIYREAFALVERGTATMEDIDRSFRYDEGSWMTLMGVFRRIDFMGLDDCHAIFSAVFPLLDNSDRMPAVMEQLLKDASGGLGAVARLHPYAPGEVEKWKEAFARFTRDINELAGQYSSSVRGDNRMLSML